CRRKDGSTFWMESVMTFLRDENGKAFSILGVSRDITERKNAEEKTNRAKEYAELLVKVSPSAIFTVDVNQRIINWNRKAEEITQYCADEMVGKECTLFAEEPCWDKCGLYAEDVKKPIVAKECTILRKDGQKRIIAKNAGLIKDEKGNIIGGIEIFEDITERKQAEEKLRNAYQKLKDTQEQLIQAGKTAAMGQLAAGVSHELNQPLTGIKGFARAILMDLEGESPFREDLHKIIEQTDRMDRIIKNVRLFARKSEFILKELDINQPIEDSFMLLNEQLKVQNIKVNKFLSKNLHKIEGDTNQLQQVFLNLITNARDAIDSLNRAEGGQITVKTALSGEGNNIEVEFTDTGCGVSNENLEYIFNPFFTTKGPDRGIGLGLAIVYRIIENHKGRIEITSEVGKGTGFKITLPIENKEESFEIKIERPVDD
ncbi:MAG: PAS domain S-box protein, partial [Candidatus Omnitrophica bacterium]|nr:PAS domain S-box protein [Candidatus Omnitrophota bacterium]